jgi:hypothetical protein
MLPSSTPLGDLPLGCFGLSNRFFGGRKMLDIALTALLALLDLHKHISRDNSSGYDTGRTHNEALELRCSLVNFLLQIREDFLRLLQGKTLRLNRR